MRVAVLKSKPSLSATMQKRWSGSSVSSSESRRTFHPAARKRLSLSWSSRRIASIRCKGPSISIASFAGRQAKSTVRPAIGCWRRIVNPWSRKSLKTAHARFSSSVLSRRSRRARRVWLGVSMIRTLKEHRLFGKHRSPSSLSLLPEGRRGRVMQGFGQGFFLPLQLAG